MLDVRRMQILRAVVTSGSVTAAATQLGYTPSAISQQVAVLERETGTALLERVGRGVRATAAGRLLTEHAGIIGQQVAEAERALADLRAGRTGRLAVRYFSSVGPTLLAPALARFRQEHPGVRIDLRLAETEDPLPELARGEVDVALLVGTGGTGGTPRAGIHLRHLLDDPYRAVLPADHPLAARRVVELADLAGEPWIGSEPPGPCLDVMLDACAAAGFTPNIVARSEDYPTAQGFVAAGLGIALVPTLGLAGRRPGLAVRPVRGPEPVRAIHAATREAGLTRRALRTLLEALEHAARA